MIKIVSYCEGCYSKAFMRLLWLGLTALSLTACALVNRPALSGCQRAADASALGAYARELCRSQGAGEAELLFAQPAFAACLARGRQAAHGQFFELQKQLDARYGRPQDVLRDCVSDLRAGRTTAPARVRVIGDLNIHSSDASWPPGLSGLCYRSSTQEFVTVSDAPGYSDAYTLKLELGGALRATLTRQIPLETQAANRYPDHEDVACYRNGDLLVSSERESPPLRRARAGDGEAPLAMSAVAIPAAFSEGMSFNAGLEGIALPPSDAFVVVANEKPLRGATEGSIQLLVLPARKTIPYFLDRLPGVGVSALALASETELLVLERGYDSATDRNSIRIYRVDLAAPKAKRLLVDVEELLPQLAPGFRRLDNFEGMTFGPTLPNGNRTLVLVSDNNLNPRQRTVFVALELLR